MRGKVKFYNVARRFGFIIPDERGPEVYFAESSLPRKRAYDPVEGDSIEYDVRSAAKGPVAVRIVLDQERDIPLPSLNGHARASAG